MLSFLDLLILIAFASDRFDDESELYKAIKHGDDNAFKKFFDAHYDALFVFLRNRNISREAAEDLIQKAFLYIWEHRKRIKPDLSLKAYLYRIAYTRMLNYLEQEPNHTTLEKHVNGTKKTPLDTIEYKDLRTAFEKAVSDLPERRRAVFESCFIEDLTYKETAEQLSISVKTVENHMALAFKDLRKELKIFNKF
ncbi:MAG: RNA polymerase sigma-70 factor [Balneolaceae bacterium]|nr:RNA polymerase sigma-70 factor [Balneolaceae bacterium]